MNVHRIESNSSGLTPGQRVIERPRRQWSLKRNEPRTWPLSEPRCVEEEKCEYENSSNTYKSHCTLFFAPIPVFVCRLKHS